MFAGNPQACPGTASRVRYTKTFLWRGEGMSEAFKDAPMNQMCWRHVTRKACVCGESSLVPPGCNLPHLLWCLTTGRQPLSSWGDGARSSLTSGRRRHRGKDFVYLWAVSAVIEKRSVPWRWNFQGESFWVSQWPLCKHLLMWCWLPRNAWSWRLYSFCAFSACYCHLRELISGPGFTVEDRVARSRSPTPSASLTLSLHWAAPMCSGTLSKRREMLTFLTTWGCFNVKPVTTNYVKSAMILSASPSSPPVPLPAQGLSGWLCWSQEEGRGCLFHHQPSPSSHLFSFQFSQVAAESGYGPVDTVLQEAWHGSLVGAGNPEDKT